MMMKKKKNRNQKQVPETEADWIPKSWTAFIEIH